jgi:peptidyl-prolyl cis-trans isomerase A (cyclophilin A)
MLKRFALLLAALLLPAAAQAQQLTNVVMTTELGEIVIALETERAPISSANFLRYVDA